MNTVPHERSSRITVEEEVPFSFEEIFFSRTNPRGVIVSGNSVFRRVSRYNWDELIGKPHNTIRHPDTPRTVFWLLWDTIKKGRPIGAYVKNRAKDGRYYWVFAIVTPIDGGYLSVRLKPSARLAPIAAEYAALRSSIDQKGLDPQNGLPILLEKLQTLGFKSYESFMAAALAEEIAARDRQISREADKSLQRFSKLAADAASLTSRAESIYSAFAKVQFVPLNLTVKAKQLGETGSAIGIISSNYNLISSEIKSHMGRFVASARELEAGIEEGRFLYGIALIQSDAAEFFGHEADDGTIDRQKEMSLLQSQLGDYRAKSVEGIRKIAAQALRFHEDCAEMKRLVTSLEVTRVMGKMESARLLARDGIVELIEELGNFQSEVAEGLKDIEGVNREIQFNATKLAAAECVQPASRVA